MKEEPIRIEVVLLAMAMWSILQIPGMIFAFGFTNHVICLSVWAGTALLAFIITVSIMNKIFTNPMASSKEETGE